MAEKSLILFDLDGTLTDPKIGITKSVAYALEKFGVKVPDMDALTPFIGPPLYESFMGFYGFSRTDADRAVVAYREYFSGAGIFENEVYEGIPEMLAALSGKGKILGLATSKPHVFAVRILEHFKLDGYFTFVSGSELDGRRNEKSEVVAYALEYLPTAAPRACVMVGDREHDIIGAKANGIDSVGVLFGYGGREELENAGATYIAGSVDELRTLLFSI